MMLSEYLHHSPLALHWFTGHFWSLSMEEHFYFLLPAILVLFRKTRLWILGGLAALVALWRFFLAHVLHHDYQFSFRTDTHLDALLIPAIVALMLFRVIRNEDAKRFLPAWSFPLLLGIEIIFLTCHIPFTFTLQAVVLPLLVLSTVLHPRAIPGKVLETFPLRWIGWISYSLYLWQQLFFGVNLVGSPPALAWLRAAPANFIGLFGCAAFSYYLVEKPCVRLGHKVQQAMAGEASDRLGSGRDGEGYEAFVTLPSVTTPSATASSPITPLEPERPCLSSS
jgi:peptidoglycan/LPS O-acetylase OafA/YrhL